MVDAEAPSPEQTDNKITERKTARNKEKQKCQRNATEKDHTPLLVYHIKHCLTLT